MAPVRARSRVAEQPPSWPSPAAEDALPRAQRRSPCCCRPPTSRGAGPGEPRGTTAREGHVLPAQAEPGRPHALGARRIIRAALTSMSTRDARPVAVATCSPRASRSRTAPRAARRGRRRAARAGRGVAPEHRRVRDRLARHARRERAARLGQPPEPDEHVRPPGGEERVEAGALRPRARLVELGARRRRAPPRVWPGEIERLGQVAAARPRSAARDRDRARVAPRAALRSRAPRRRARRARSRAC